MIDEYKRIVSINFYSKNFFAINLLTKCISIWKNKKDHKIRNKNNINRIKPHKELETMNKCFQNWNKKA